jgi:hypothetical protein
MAPFTCWSKPFTCWSKTVRLAAITILMPPCALMPAVALARFLTVFSFPDSQIGLVISFTLSYVAVSPIFNTSSAASIAFSLVQVAAHQSHRRWLGPSSALISRRLPPQWSSFAVS